MQLLEQLLPLRLPLHLNPLVTKPPVTNPLVTKSRTVPMERERSSAKSGKLSGSSFDTMLTTDLYATEE